MLFYSHLANTFARSAQKAGLRLWSIFPHTCGRKRRASQSKGMWQVRSEKQCVCVGYHHPPAVRRARVANVVEQPPVPLELSGELL